MKPETPEHEAANASFLERVNDALHSSAHRIAEITARDGIAVLMVDALPEGQAAASNLGWDGVSSVWEMSRDAAEGFAVLLKSRGDALTARWLRRRGGPCRVFVLVDGGNLLMNFSNEKSWHLEPGSTDSEWLS